MSKMSSDNMLPSVEGKQTAYNFVEENQLSECIVTAKRSFFGRLKIGVC